MDFQFISDMGHGWLRVPAGEVVKLGLASKISCYSFISPDGHYAYLEEDCDAALFVGAYCEQNNITDYVFMHDLTNYASVDTWPGRSFERWGRSILLKYFSLEV